MHLQPLYRQNEMVGGAVSERLFAQGICLPSGTAMSEEEMARVMEMTNETGQPSWPIQTATFLIWATMSIISKIQIGTVFHRE